MPLGLVEDGSDGQSRFHPRSSVINADGSPAACALQHNFTCGGSGMRELTKRMTMLSIVSKIQVWLHWQFRTTEGPSFDEKVRCTPARSERATVSSFTSYPSTPVFNPSGLKYVRSHVRLGVPLKGTDQGLTLTRRLFELNSVLHGIPGRWEVLTGLSRTLGLRVTIAGGSAGDGVI